MDCRFFIGEWAILDKWYTVRESFAKHVPVFVAPSCSKALASSDIATRISLAHQFIFVLNPSDSGEALQVEDARHFLDATIQVLSEVEYQRLRQSSAAWYSSSKQLLIHHLVNEVERLI